MYSSFSFPEEGKIEKILLTDVITDAKPILVIKTLDPDVYSIQPKMLDPGVESSDADPGSGAFYTPRSGMGKKSGSGSGINNPNHISQSLKNNFLDYS